MFDNIECLGNNWICFLDEPYLGNFVVYAGQGTESVTGAEEYWQ
jgi:hypothetical protein